MADIYLSSVDGSDADTGLTWALAKATLSAALTAADAGGRVFVDHAHAETQTTDMTLTSPGTAASPVQVLCVDRTGNPEPPTALATTATVTTTGTSDIRFSGFGYIYGITFTAGTSGDALVGFESTSPWWFRCESCALKLGSGAGSTARITFGTSGALGDDVLLELINTKMEFSHALQGILLRAPLRWTDTASAITGGTLPTTLFITSTNIPSSADVSGVDLSALATGKNLVDVSVAKPSRHIFSNCKLGSGVSITTGTNPGQGGFQVWLINCDSADTNYRYQYHSYMGDIFHETVIVRTSGATDGTTPISRKMVSSANARFIAPLVTDPMVRWNETTGVAKTATVEIVNDGLTLKNDEIWLEIEYLGTAGFPLSKFAHDSKANVLATAANQTTSTIGWTTTGLTTPIKQKLEVTFTPQEKGPIVGRVMVARASITVYVDPVMTIA